MSVLDLDGERAFFRALGFHERDAQRLSGPSFEQLTGINGASAEQTRVALGQESLVLAHFLSPHGNRIEVHRSNDVGFEHIAIVVNDMDTAYRRLSATAMRAVSVAPQLLPASNPVAGGVRAFYFRDPDGHFLELLQFPPDKGAAAWHQDPKQLFLGIDHSAIVTTSTERSLGFYRDVLGLRVASQSLNEGREQELLSGVSGARVKVTSLRGAHGPGIELLEYIAPGSGPQFPARTTAADSIHWEIALQVLDVAGALEALRTAGFAGLASKPVDTHLLFAGTEQSAIVRDPDGHSVRLFKSAPGLAEQGAR